MDQGKIARFGIRLCVAGSLAAGVSAGAAALAADTAAEGDGYRVLPLVEITGQPGARLQWQDTRGAYFGLGDRYLFATDKFLTVHEAALDAAAPRTYNGTANLSGSVGYDVGPNRFGIPLVHQTYQTDEGARRFDAYGLEWRRKFGTAHELAVSARRGEYGALDGGTRDSSTGNVAQLAWSSAFAGGYQPRIMGSVYLGDETAKDKGPKWFGRKYVGLSLDGSFTAFERHTPYASLHLQRSDYDATETSLSAARREDYSRLAAGWNWQVRPNWGLRAEANYVLNVSGQAGYDYERSQLLFSTRFGFK